MGKLGENIKRIREEMGLSQRQFGELIGKSDSQIWSYEMIEQMSWRQHFIRLRR